MRHSSFAFLGALLVGMALVVPAQEPSDSTLRQRLAEDPLHIHLLDDERLDAGGLALMDEEVLARADALATGGLIVVTSEPGLRWQRDVEFREALLATGRPRDVVFAPTDSLQDVLGTALIRADDSLEEAVALLVDELGSRDWSEREQAMDELAGLGRAALTAMRGEQSRATDPEVIWRIDLVVDRLSRQAMLQQGFLGIAYHYRAIDPGGPDSTIRGAIAIQQVFSGTEAERVGLRDGDLVISINDKPLTDPLGTGRITRIFAGLRRGQRISLGVVRGAEEFRISATMGIREESRRD